MKNMTRITMLALVFSSAAASCDERKSQSISRTYSESAPTTVAESVDSRVAAQRASATYTSRANALAYSLGDCLARVRASKEFKLMNTSDAAAFEAQAIARDPQVVQAKASLAIAAAAEEAADEKWRVDDRRTAGERNEWRDQNPVSIALGRGELISGMDFGQAMKAMRQKMPCELTLEHFTASGASQDFGYAVPSGIGPLNCTAAWKVGNDLWCAGFVDGVAILVWQNGSRPLLDSAAYPHGYPIPKNVLNKFAWDADMR